MTCKIWFIYWNLDKLNHNICDFITFDSHPHPQLATSVIFYLLQFYASEYLVVTLVETDGW